MRKAAWKGSFGLAIVAAASLLGADGARAQTTDFDHLTCVRVSTDRRLAKTPPPLTLDAEQAQLLDSQGCKVVGGGRVARADELCFATSKDPGGPPSGIDLSGQSFLCYRVKCERDEMNLGGRTELSVTDQFGDGTVFLNERPTTKRLCVPAFIDQNGPTPTPGPTGTPGGTPSVTPTPIPIGTPTATPTSGTTPTPTPGGSASRAFVERSASLLN